MYEYPSDSEGDRSLKVWITPTVLMKGRSSPVYPMRKNDKRSLHVLCMELPVHPELCERDEKTFFEEEAE
ncbi:hypothetical protein BAPNAU_2594 [Bacillus velezensis NAU-B3]|nr:hypothetical protein BAPNAU_2594 [Bacillus velezensis NAU-B3]